VPDANRTPDSRPQKIKMTPQIVERLLAVNDHNRNIRTNKVFMFRDIFLRGEWIGDTPGDIGVRGTIRSPGRLQNGQHRLLGLHAAFEANPDLEVTMWIWENVPDTVQLVIDTGTKRSFGDVLKLEGEASANTLAAVVNLSMRVEHDRLIGGGGQFTNVEMLNHFHDNEWLRDGLPYSRRIITEFRLSQAGLAYAMARADRTGGAAEADAFTSGIVWGANMNRGHPIMRLREQLIDWQREKKRAGAGALAHVVAATTIQAWNLVRKGETSVPRQWVQWDGHDFPSVL